MIEILSEITQSNIADISKSLDYELSDNQLNACIFLYISGDYQKEIEYLLTDINYHSLLAKLKDFADFVIDYFK